MKKYKRILRGHITKDRPVADKNSKRLMQVLRVDRNLRIRSDRRMLQLLKMDDRKDGWFEELLAMPLAEEDDEHEGSEIEFRVDEGKEDGEDEEESNPEDGIASPHELNAEGMMMIQTNDYLVEYGKCRVVM
jgi:hypothetical protein